jgi:hypothetical protein
MPRKTKKTTRKVAKAPALPTIDVEYVAQVARPIVERDRHLTPAQIGHLLRAMYPRKWRAHELKRVVSENFEMTVDLSAA